jgi:prohibitin 1
LTFAITHDEFLWQVSSRIREDLLARAGEFNIKLEDVSITHLTFGKV